MNHQTKYPNIVEFEVYGPYALFSDPIMKIGGEKCSYQIPTYEAIKGVLQSIYLKPTIQWYIDEVRIMNPIRMETSGILVPRYHGGNDLSYYTYLRDVCYQVRAHFEWNLNRPELENDRNENKHHNIAKRMIERGGRRDIYLGTRECQAYVEPCTFGEEKGAYDTLDRMDFGLMYHGMTYADEAYSEETEGKMTARFWHPVMEHGIVKFDRPEMCPIHKPLQNMEIKKFGEELDNFSGVKEFEGEGEE